VPQQAGEPSAIERTATAAAHCRALEDGCILLLADTPLGWTADDRAMLLRPDRMAASHKNIAYRLDQDRLVGVGRRGDADDESLRRVLRAYAERMTALLVDLLAPYASRWRVDYTSLRPQEEAGRSLPWRARNDLLHIDAFPSRPTNGDRILRVFTNLHPTRPRRWVTTDPFDVLLRHFVTRAAAPMAPPRRHAAWRAVRRRLAPHAPAALAPILRRSAYDAFMLRFHDQLKSDAHFQATAPKQTWEFPPGASWIAFTDFVPHAALSGQGALEQTYFVPRSVLLQPEKAPAAILERLCGAVLTD
jgi:hypothetical protein